MSKKSAKPAAEKPEPTLAETDPEAAALEKANAAKARRMRGKRFRLVFEWETCLVLQDVIDDAIRSESSGVEWALRPLQIKLHTWTGEELPPSKRAGQPPAPPAAAAADPTSATNQPGRSLEECVDLVYRHLALIHASCQADQDLVFIDHDVVMGAISQAALEAAQALEPLRHAPGEVANWTPAATEGAR